MAAHYACELPNKLSFSQSITIQRTHDQELDSLRLRPQFNLCRDSNSGRHVHDCQYAAQKATTPTATRILSHQFKGATYSKEAQN